MTLLFVMGHFAFLMWRHGHLRVIQGAEAKYDAQVEKFNADARQLLADNVKIAASAERIATETTKAEKLRNDTAYQNRLAVEAGGRILRSAPAGAVAPGLR